MDANLATWKSVGKAMIHNENELLEKMSGKIEIIRNNRMREVMYTIVDSIPAK